MTSSVPPSRKASLARIRAAASPRPYEAALVTGIGKAGVVLTTRYTHARRSRGKVARCFAIRPAAVLLLQHHYNTLVQFGRPYDKITATGSRPGTPSGARLTGHEAHRDGAGGGLLAELKRRAARLSIGYTTYVRMLINRKVRLILGGCQLRRLNSPGQVAPPFCIRNVSRGHRASHPVALVHQDHKSMRPALDHAYSGKIHRAHARVVFWDIHSRTIQPTRTCGSFPI